MLHDVMCSCLKAVRECLAQPPEQPLADVHIIHPAAMTFEEAMMSIGPWTV